MDYSKPHKPPRLKGYDYATPGYYFVTFNTRIRGENTLADVGPGPCSAVGAAALGGPGLTLTPAGKIVDGLINRIDYVYPDVHVDCYCIMPDHVHLILALGHWETHEGPPRAAAPTALSAVINALKGLSTKQVGCPLWQDEYYDHIIRTPEELSDTRQYIQNNPQKLTLDKD